METFNSTISQNMKINGKNPTVGFYRNKKSIREKNISHLETNI